MFEDSKASKFSKEAIDKMFEIAGYDLTFDTIPERLDSKDPWYQRYTMTLEQRAEWKAWFITEVRKRLRFTKRKAEKEFTWFDLDYGLKIAG